MAVDQRTVRPIVSTPTRIHLLIDEDTADIASVEVYLNPRGEVDVKLTRYETVDFNIRIEGE